MPTAQRCRTWCCVGSGAAECSGTLLFVMATLLHGARAASCTALALLLLAIRAVVALALARYASRLLQRQHSQRDELRASFSSLRFVVDQEEAETLQFLQERAG